MILLCIFFLLMVLLKSSAFVPFSDPGKSTSIALGFILIFAFLFGKKINRLKLPQITGFILAGILSGPYVMKFLNTLDVKGLQLIDGLALSLIALTAGGEMRVKRLRESARAISAIVLFQTVVIIAGFVIFGLLGRSFFSFFSEKTFPQILVLSMLLGILATATSPSTTIAVITETKSKGKYTDLILSAAVVKDFFVIGLFAFCLSFSKSLLSPVKGFDTGFLFQILKEVIGSVIIGAGVGVAIALYLKYVKRELAVFVLGMAFFTYQIAHSYGYHPLLICLTAGFLIQNFSSHGESLIQTIEKSSTPVYVMFFAISGASLDLSALKTGWILAMICVILRAALKFTGTYVGARLSKEGPGVQKYSWLGFISQAGVALGMAIVIEGTFPDWGGEFKALVLAIIAINQIIGPVLLQRLLIRVNEAGKKGEK